MAEDYINLVAQNHDIGYGKGTIIIDGTVVEDRYIYVEADNSVTIYVGNYGPGDYTLYLRNSIGYSNVAIFERFTTTVEQTSTTVPTTTTYSAIGIISIEPSDQSEDTLCIKGFGFGSRFDSNFVIAVDESGESFVLEIQKWTDSEILASGVATLVPGSYYIYISFESGRRSNRFQVMIDATAKER